MSTTKTIHVPIKKNNNNKISIKKTTPPHSYVKYIYIYINLKKKKKLHILCIGNSMICEL